MALRVALIETSEGEAWVVESPEGLRRLSGAYTSTRAFFENGGEADAAKSVTDGAIVEATCFLSPVTRDAKFVCQATNYADHIREVGGDPTHVVNNILFTKASSCIVPADSDVIRPAHVKLLDYEIELGLVLKKGFDAPVDITPETLGEWVGGLVIVNDITARDVQVSHTQFHKSKSYRTFGPVGPWLVLPDASDLAKLFDLELTLEVDGEVRQKALAKEMIFKPAATLKELSTIMDLDAGDLIATGTPAGVALAPPSAFKQALAGFLKPAKRFAIFMKGQLASPKYLQRGQTMTASIKSADGSLDLGEQRNLIR